MRDTVNCLIDTKEMAISVDGVSRNISNTTAAVLAMQAAVIASENEAADTICRNVDRGFLSLMQSQISTKKAQHFSALNAHLLKLMELSKALQSREDRMEDDFARLQRQYYKTFRNIDRALENRVRQLDKHSVEMADTRKNLITNPQLKDLVTVTESENEAHTTAQLALNARIRSKTSRALTSVGINVMETEQYRKELTGILESRSTPDVQTEYVPLICVTESSMVMQGNPVSQMFLPETLSKVSRDAITNKAEQTMNLFASSQKSNDEKDEITREFRNMTSSANLDPEVTGLMLQLFEKGDC